MNPPANNRKIIERIEREAGIPDLASLLADQISATDLQSLLLEVYRLRAQRQTPAAVLADYESNRFTRPSKIDPVKLLAWEQAAFAQLPPEFQPIELSPLCPLGTNSAVALVDQNRAVSTIRNTEVVSDSTNVLALEAAVQRRQHLKQNAKSKTEVHLAAKHRLLRPQHYGDPNALSHFQIFSLCSAGRDEGNLRFELRGLLTHILFYVRALRAYGGNSIPLEVMVSDFNTQSREALIESAIFNPVRESFPDVQCSMETDRISGRDYYIDLCFHIYAANAAGQRFQLADGGVVNWTQRLLSSAKERCVISGIGSERVCLEFGA